MKKPAILLFLQLMMISMSGQDLAFNTPAAPGGSSEEYATLHIYRPRALYGVIWNYDIKVDGEKIKMKNGSYYALKIKPGDRNLKIIDFGKRQVNLNFEAGKDYYIQTYLRRAIFMAVPEMAEVTPRFGIEQIDKLKK